jgi:hypothetical protein
MKIFEFDIFFHAIQITGLVFIMMVIIDWLDVRTRGRLPQWIANNRLKQYTVAGLLGLTPGCMGSYMNVSLYIHGYLSIGAIVGGMIATTGEAALIMFALFPKTAIVIHLILISLGIIFALTTDLIVRLLKIEDKCECEAIVYHKDETSLGHYLKEHLWGHIIKKHIWRIFLWTFLAIWFVHLGENFWDLRTFVSTYPQLVLLLAVLIGLIPDVAPQFIFIFMFHDGLIPFSVLLTSSIIQNGHGLIPLLSYSLKNTLVIKGFNVLFGIIVGILVMAFGY